jgi:PIN domain nuclease of toxin-antitoxin system
MKILLDTCEFLWLVSGDTRLSVDVLNGNMHMLTSNQFAKDLKVRKRSLEHILCKKEGECRMGGC